MSTMRYFQDITYTVDKRYSNNFECVAVFINYLISIVFFFFVYSKREKRHALPYAFGGDGGRGSVMFLYNSQSAMDENEDSTNTTTTTMDKNRIRQSFEIEYTQKRRRRSVSNVKSTSKTGVPVLAGINPFALILVNRVHNNKTGSIKPLGLWDQITKLFKN